MVNTFHTHLSQYMNAVKPQGSNPQGTRKKRLLNKGWLIQVLLTVISTNAQALPQVT